VMDRAYVDFQRLDVFHCGGAFFVTRTKKGIQLRRRYSHDVDSSTGLRSDQTVVLASASSSKHYPEPNAETSPIKDEPATPLAGVYRQRPKDMTAKCCFM
jgi:hypothetical protein